jgi:hypothetical protein
MRGNDCPSFGGNVLSRHFVEFQAGTITRIGLKVGDKIGWDLHFSNGGHSKGGLPIQDKSPTPAKKPSPAKKPAPKPGAGSSKK